MEPITSTRNPRVRELAELARPQARRERGLHLVEGPNAVGEAVAAGVVEEVFVTEHGRQLLTVPTRDGVRCTLVADHVLARLADATTPQGIVAVARNRSSAIDEVVGRGLLVVLHEVADPGNLGTVLRTADAAGAAGVVLTDGSVDPYSPKAVRAAAGSTYHLPIVTGIGFDVVVEACRSAGQPVLGLDGGGDRSVFDLQRTDGPLALVLGNEAHGLPSAATALLDGMVAIPIYGGADSLNVAAAAAIAIYAAAQGLAGQDGVHSDGAGDPR